MSQVHYEVFARRTVNDGWTLQMATEDRVQAIQQAEDMLGDKRAVSVRVTKETLDPDTMAFMSVTVLTKGAPEPERRRAVDKDRLGSNCTAPQDLYAPHARETIARVLEDWLARHRVTAFELMHRPDLVEKLEASGVEYQHAVQKVAVPESQGTGQPVHELIRHYQRLTTLAMERVIKAGQRNSFPDLDRESVADVVARLAGNPDRSFLLGGALAARLAPVRGWRAKIGAVLDVVDAAPTDTGGHALVMVVAEQLLTEILGLREGLADLLGPALDPGGTLLALAALTAPRELEIISRMDSTLAERLPTLEGPSLRLAQRMQAGDFKLLAAGLSRQILRELSGPRRLCPSSALSEIELLRALATLLTAAAGRLMSLEEVQDAFIERSKAIVGADFVEAYLGKDKSPFDEARALVMLCENVTGLSSKRAAARWLAACVTNLKFEKDLRSGSVGPAQRLAQLAALQKSVAGCGLLDKDSDEITTAIGQVGGLVEADARLVAGLARSPAPAPRKLAALLKLAAGDAASQGPATDRARLEAVRLLKVPETRQAMASDPVALGEIRSLMSHAGLAA